MEREEEEDKVNSEFVNPEDKVNSEFVKTKVYSNQTFQTWIAWRRRRTFEKTWKRRRKTKQIEGKNSWERGIMEMKEAGRVRVKTRLNIQKSSRAF